MITKHITTENLTGYIHQTLDDAQREEIDAHLVECPSCRASVAQQEIQYRQISNELVSILNFTTPSPQMNFSAIAPRLHRHISQNILLDRAIFVPMTLALTGFVFALFGLWRAIGNQAFTSPAQPLGVFPPLACFFLVLASVQQSDSSYSPRWSRRAITWIIVLILWLGSAFIGLLDIIALSDLAIIVVIAMGGQKATAEPVAMTAVLLGALLYVGFIIGGAEFHYRNVGQARSWKLLSITLLIQLFILILPYLLR